MLNRLVEISLKNRGLVLGITGILIIFGLLGVSQLPIDAVPDITNIQVVVNTKTGALDPEKIEILVTRPIETEMTGLEGLEEARSISKYGLSQVTLIFSEGTDIYRARQQVTERLQNAKKDLPESVSPELAPITTGLGEVVFYSVEAVPGSALAAMAHQPKLTYLRTIQDFVIRPALRRVGGVADVDSIGGFKKEVHVNFFPDRLERVGLSVEQLASRLHTLGESFGGGYIQREGKQVIVRTVPGLSELKDLENISLGLDVHGRPIRLKEVAEIREDHALRLGAATRDGQETVLGTVMMRMGANSRKVAQDTENLIAELKLPEGVKIAPLYSRKFLVDATINTVEKSLIEGAVLVITVLILLLGHARAALIVACTIPISMLIAGRGMLNLGISGNLMSLGAIDFGLLVDGSVVIIENVIKRMNESKGPLDPEGKRKLIFEASTEVIKPVVFGLFMIMVVYVPILTLQGIEGKMFRPMAATVLLALFASLLVAVFVMPVLADTLIPLPKKATSNPLDEASSNGHEHEEDTWLFKKIKNIYVPALSFVIQKPRMVLIPSALLLVVGAMLLSRLGSDFIPRLDEGDLVVGIMRDSKLGINRSVEQQIASDQIIGKHSEVATVFSRIGTSEAASDPMGVNLSDTFVILNKDKKKWTVPSKTALFDKIRDELLQANSEQDLFASQPIEMRFNEMLEGSRADVTLRIFGIDLTGLVSSIEKAKKVLEKVRGIDTLGSDPTTALKTSPMLDVAPIYTSQAKYGITLAELNHLVSLSMGGKELGSFFESGRRFPIVIHLDESLREDLSTIENLPVGLPMGGTIPLSQLAKISIQDRVTTIARSWGERYAAVSINIENRDIASFVAEAQAKIQSDLELGKDQRVSWGGQFKNLDRAKKRLFIIVPLTLAAVFIILLRSFGSLTDTLLVFSSIPFAAVGGVYALWLRDMNLSVSAAVGFIALIGIALLNSLVLMNVLNRSNFSTISELHRYVSEAALSRLRPVLMTALVASLGFLPMALNTGLGAEVQKPLATVVIGGLMTATLLTLVLLPLIFIWVKSRSNWVPAALTVPFERVIRPRALDLRRQIFGSFLSHRKNIKKSQIKA